MPNHTMKFVEPTRRAACAGVIAQSRYGELSITARSSPSRTAATSNLADARDAVRPAYGPSQDLPAANRARTEVLGEFNSPLFNSISHGMTAVLPSIAVNS
jgi:hypothetical protein